MSEQPSRRVLTDASRLIIEAAVRAGADVFVGYPITPANWLYHYATQRFPTTLPATDEITTLQWMAGFAAAGRFPVTATSFPGFALMVESVNMAYMMELPMLIVLVQRLGPSTGSATTGAQGDLLLLRGVISGGYPLPVFSPSNFEDCWELTGRAVAASLQMRTPVVLLTSKEMVMTSRSFDLSRLPAIERASWPQYRGSNGYLPYRANPAEPPPFLPVGNRQHQVRINASTHDASGLIRKATPEALANTRRLQEKIQAGMEKHVYFEYDPAPDADALLVTYGVTAEAGRDAIRRLQERGRAVSLLVVKTLLPFPQEALAIIRRYARVLIAEENLSGLLRELIYGQMAPTNVVGVNQIGKLISPEDIVAGYEKLSSMPLSPNSEAQEGKPS